MFTRQFCGPVDAAGVDGGRRWRGPLEGGHSKLVCQASHVYDPAMTHRWFWAVAAVFVTGCFSHTSAQERHAAFYGCTAGEVTSEEAQAAGRDVVRTKGCGHEEEFYCVGIKCRAPRLHAIRIFAGETDCETSQVTASNPEGDRWSVTGCGKTLEYVCTPAGGGDLTCTKQ